MSAVSVSETVTNLLGSLLPSSINKDKVQGSNFNKLDDRLKNKETLNTSSSVTDVSSSSSSSSSIMANSKGKTTRQEASVVIDSSYTDKAGKGKGEATRKKTLGKGWFDLAPAEMTEELKRDIKVIKMRNFIDPKRFYKTPDALNTVIHTGTVIEGPDEYVSGRLTRKQRKGTVVEEIMSDTRLKDYSKRAYGTIQAEKSNKIKFGKRGGKDSNKKKKTAHAYF